MARHLQSMRAMEQVRQEELRTMTDAQALEAAENLLDLLRFLPPREEMSGLVEQQRLFARLRK
jgi:hypothetical protein